MSQSTRDLAFRWFEEVWNQRRAETMPDLRITVEDVIADDRAAVARWRIDASHTGEGMGVAPTGKPVTFSGMTWLEFRDGQIVQAWDRWNRDGFLKQLGV